jgi:galactokinase
VIQNQAATEQFKRTFGAEPEVVAFAPGRVNLLGEHIDYVDGWVLPAALAKGVTVAARESRPGRIRIHSDQYLDAGVAEFDPDSPPPQAYLKFVHELAMASGARGAELAVVSDLPIEAGWSSSAAFAVAVLAALTALEHTLARPAALEICFRAQRAEIRALGIEVGLMDQYASVFGKSGHAVWFDTRHLQHDYVPVELPGAVFVQIDSGQPRRLAESGYNQRRGELAAALESLAKRVGGFKSIRELDPGQVLDELEHLTDVSQRRLRHIITEHLRVARFVEHLKQHDHMELGALLSATQNSLSRDYEVSTPELDMLCDMLPSAPGIYGARLVGGGFGGGVLALMDERAAAEELEPVLAEFSARTGLEPVWEIIEIGDGALIERPGQMPEPVKEWLP